MLCPKMTVPKLWGSASVAANLRELLPLLCPSPGTRSDVTWSLSLPLVSKVLAGTDDSSLEDGPTLVLQTISSACKAHASVPEVRGCGLWVWLHVLFIFSLDILCFRWLVY